jgi:integrase/recombinase XerC
MVSLPLLPDAADAQKPMAIALCGGRKSQTRTLRASAPLEASMLNWLALRASRPRAGANDPVFASQKGGGATAVSAKAIFELANGFILETLGTRYPEGLAHAGPTTLRNSCIVRWLDEGMPEDDVVKQAGFLDVQALRRLRQHQHPNPNPVADLTQLTTPAAGDDDERHDPPR